MARRSGYLLGAKGQYWQARCLREEGREDEAQESFRALAERYTFTYYGLMARVALGEAPLPARSVPIPQSPMEMLVEVEGTSSELASLRLF